MSDNFKPTPANTSNGTEDGEHSGLDVQYEPNQEPQIGTGKNGTSGDAIEADSPVNISAAVERFVEQTRARLRSETQENYLWAFQRLVKESELNAFTRRQLAGPKGRLLLLSHIEHIPQASRRVRIAQLKTVWTFGLNLPWPIDVKRDIGKLPRVGRRESAPDSVMMAWKNAIAHEPDLRFRLEWLLIAQHGWRPSHIIRLKWRNVRYDETGKPIAIVANGALEGFKTSSPIAARLSPDVRDALDTWKKLGPEPLPDWPIFPRGDTPGRLAYTQKQGKELILRHFRHLQEYWKLPHLRPVDVRHWVAKICRVAGLSKQASAYLMGHDPTQGGSMRDWYDNPQLEDIFAEQTEMLPHGPLGMLENESVELMNELPSDAVTLMHDYLTGQIGTMEFATKVETIRLRNAPAQLSRPET